MSISFSSQIKDVFTSLELKTYSLIQHQVPTHRPKHIVTQDLLYLVLQYPLFSLE